MQVDMKKIGYNVSLDAAENIKILVNDNEVFNETIAAAKKGRVSFSFQEFIEEP